MSARIAAAFALTAASSLSAQPAAPATDLSIATPAQGSWTYAVLSGGSEATFTNASAQAQLVVHCARAARQVTISTPASAATPVLSVWTSTQTRNLPASFDPATARLSATISAFDSLLDAIAFSRGRAGFTITGQPALVVPSWAEAARVVEDCRA